MAQTYDVNLRRYNGVDWDTMLPTPKSHADTHKTDGTDPLTADDIGAKSTSSIEDIAHGGTGANNASSARENLGITPLNIGAKAVGAVEDIAHGGTGATTAGQARTNLGITPENIGAVKFGQIDSGDMNELLTPGHYRIMPGVANLPPRAGGLGQALIVHGAGDTTIQFYAIASSNEVYVRCKTGSTWFEWKLIVAVNNDDQYNRNIAFTGQIYANNHAHFNANMVLSAASYGANLPAAGTAGRIFFKKVT